MCVCVCVSQSFSGLVRNHWFVRCSPSGLWFLTDDQCGD